MTTKSVPIYGFQALKLPHQFASQVIASRQNGLTQAQFADKVSARPSSIARLENLSKQLPSLSFLVRIADVMEQTVEVCFSERGYKHTRL